MPHCHFPPSIVIIIVIIIPLVAMAGETRRPVISSQICSMADGTAIFYWIFEAWPM
jgi:hypothetical protein